MTLTTKQAAEAARDLITEQPESVAGYSVPKIMAMIPHVVKDYGLDVARDPARRNYCVTDPAAVTVAVAAGVADATQLAALFTTSKVYEETFELSEFYVANAGAPVRVKLLRSREQLKQTRTGEGEYVYGFWDGPSMLFRNTDGSTTSLTDTLQVRASREPAPNLSDLHPRLEQDFINYLAARAAAELGRSSSGQQQPATS